MKDKKKEKNLVKRDDNADQDKKNTRGRIIFIIIVCLSIILIIYASLFGIKLRFNLSDELEIKLAPLEQTFNVRNNENIRLSFDIQNNNFAECKSICEFKLVDLSDNKVLYIENKTLNHDEAANKNYSILAPENGKGKKVYSFKVECKNINSLICFSDEKTRMRSSIIFVNYDLRDEEKNIISEIKPKIENFMSRVRAGIKLQKQSISLLERIPDSIIEKENIKKKVENDKDLMNSELIKIKEIERLWKVQDYISLNSVFVGYENSEAEEIIRSSNLSILESMELIKLRNDNTQSIKKFNKSIMNDSYSFYFLEINPENLKRLEDLESASDAINYDYLILKNEISFSEKNFTEKIENDLELSNILNSKFKNITSEGNSILQRSISSLSINNISLSNVSLNKSLCYNLHILNDKIKKEMGIIKNDSNKTSIYLNLNNTFNGLNIYQDLNCKSKNSALTNSSELMKFDKTRLLIKTNFSGLKIIDDQVPEVNLNFSTSLDFNPEICCTFQECRICDANIKNIPTIFIHGHSVNNKNNPEFSMNLFTKIQEKLEQDNELIDAGQLDLKINPENLTAGSWGMIGRSISVRSSYYYITYYDLGGYTVSAQKYERIENYAIRLHEIVDLVKLRTGSEKVNIVAHSMGGLVAREYINLFGGDDINKLITVNTPNHGISGRVAKLCSVIGSEKECEDMKENSVFLYRLNAKKVPSTIRLYAIRSAGCFMEEGEGDGIVTARSAYLENAENFLINGSCTDDLQTDLHSKVLDPDEYPEGYAIIKKILVK